MDVIDELSDLTRGLFYPSEEDAPLEVKDLGVSTGVPGAVLKSYPAAVPMPMIEFFAAPVRGGFAAAFPENVAGFARLLTRFEETTRACAAYRAGDTRLVAGQLEDGRIVVVATSVVET